MYPHRLGLIYRHTIYQERAAQTVRGQFMRRLLKEIPWWVMMLEGDTTTLEDFYVIAKLRADEERVTRPHPLLLN